MDICLAARYAILSGLLLASSGAAADSPVVSTTLLQDDKTILGQQLGYRGDGPLEISSSLVVLEPGAEIAEHLHPVPTYGYVIEGELTVFYPEGEKRVYKQGEALLEAVNIWHHGYNSGDVPVRILVVHMGVRGVPNTIAR